MKNNWLITHTIVGLVISSLCVRAAELTQAVPVPSLDELGYPTNELIALELGRADATRDATNGVLRLPMYGEPSEWSSDFTRVLEEKYQVQRYGLGGPLVSPSLTAYARGYSEISDHAIKEKFGSNFFERVQAEAKQAYDQRMQAQAVASSATTSVAAAPAVASPTAATSVIATPAVAAPAVETAPAVTTPAIAMATPVVPAQAAAPTNRTYRVKPGDTFWEIARQHRVPVSSLVAANPGVNPGKLQINHSLNVPTVTRP